MTVAADAALPPSHCDVLVVGAGPAGSACATALARAGLHVVLVDQHPVGRDKVCGDGLIPDAHAALHELGVLPEVAALWQPLGHVRCVAPRGRQVDVPGHLAVLPRKAFDEVLVRHAQKTGAQLAMPWKFEGLIEGDEAAASAAPQAAASAQPLSRGRVLGARLRQGQARCDVQARWVVLATGAVPQALMAAGQCQRHTPSSMAIRGYIRNEALAQRWGANGTAQLHIVWHKALRGGYGWIFPAPGGVFNIGAGLADSHETQTPAQEGSAPGPKTGPSPGASPTAPPRARGRMREVNLRQLFERFCEVYAPARELVAGGQWLGELKGAPLRCSLEGATPTRPGLLVAGEAVGSTYAFTGEGIGKAMETGLLAAQTLVSTWRQEQSDAACCAQYEAALAGLKPRFEVYERAQWVNQHPWLIDLLLWRASKSPRIVGRMASVLNETGHPGQLLTFKGFRRLFTE